jgi:hypothetical protein
MEGYDYKSHSGGREFKSPLLHHETKRGSPMKLAPFFISQVESRKQAQASML